LHEALVVGQLFSSAWWKSLLGERQFSQWRQRGLVETNSAGLVSATFRALPLDELLLLSDPLATCFENRVHFGRDSLNMAEFLQSRTDDDLRPAQPRRFLDVGTGTGVILLNFARFFDEAVGIDINPRAVVATRLNARLNGVANARAIHRDIFCRPEDLGEFQFVTWNAPFMFFPHDERAKNIDGYGGNFGIELTLDFLKVLPGLLAPSGQAFVLTAAPVMFTNENRLISELSKVARESCLDVSVHFLFSFWFEKFGAFYRQHGIRRFESVILEIRSGTGRLERVSPRWTRRVGDRMKRMVKRL
jgi:SAM-dependent methyltransferase